MNYLSTSFSSLLELENFTFAANEIKVPPLIYSVDVAD
jgi:hypothetical protein